MLDFCFQCFLRCVFVQFLWQIVSGLFSGKCSHSLVMCLRVCFYGNREHGEGIGWGWEQFLGRGLPATVSGGETTQGRGEKGAVGIQNILHIQTGHLHGWDWSRRSQHANIKPEWELHLSLRYIKINSNSNSHSNKKCLHSKISTSEVEFYIHILTCLSKAFQSALWCLPSVFNPPLFHTRTP